MEILILGGTKFLGPHLIRAANDRGHSVTTFTRGLHQREDHSPAESLIGDRNTDLQKLSERRWDAVIDTSGYLPSQAASSARFFSTRAGRYLFVSSISVYSDFSAVGIREDAPVQSLTDEQLARAEATDTSGAVSAVSFGEMYGALKARCEREAMDAMPNRTTVIRPGLIVGPEDSTDRFTYWIARVDRGGETGTRTVDT
jgi:2'-hydroxyisoflavone reductase